MARFMMVVDGKKRATEAKRFSMKIGGESFSFAVHLDPQFRRTLSHWQSGHRVCFISSRAFAAALGDELAAAKADLRALIAEKGEARVASVLRAA